ncbi:hypothetical protein V6Z12_D12G189800 [Gossypium hirsutum]
MGYDATFGQVINFMKSSVIFSSKIKEHICHIVCNILGVSASLNHGRNQVFAFIKEQLSKRIQSWKNKLLSRAGKEVVIKTMAQAILVYSMSVFLLPHNFCDDLKKMMNFFWWGSGDRLCVSKKFGGMGFSNLYCFNLALFGKE